MANSRWLLWIGLFLCCTGIGTIGGLLMVAIYFYNDYTGKQIKNIVLENKNSEAVNLESLNSGIYIAQIQIAGKTSSFKFVIN